MRISATVNVVSSIYNNILIPITADIEAGYSVDIEEIDKNITKIINAGAIGINLEDSRHDGSNKLFDIAVQCKKITAIRDLANSIGIKLFINARTDTFLISDDSIDKKVTETMNRARRYIDSGADWIFVPDKGDLDINILSGLVKKIKAPLNIIASTNTLPIPVLKEIGVQRISLGPKARRATFFLLHKISVEILSEGTFKLLENGPFTYSYVHSWFESKDQNK